MRALFAVVALAAALLTACSLPVRHAPVGFSVSLVGIGYVVPARAVCDLLARGA